MIDKLLPVSNMASSRSEENVNLKHPQHLKVSQFQSVLQFYFGHFCLPMFGRCYCPCLFSHILLFGRCYCHLLFLWWMLYHLFYVMSDWNDMRADVIAIHFCDWCNCHILVLIFVTDVIVTCLYWSLWLMLLWHVCIDLCDWCY